MRGRFVTFEGIDGSGKSSTIAIVHQALLDEGHAVLLTREETPTWRGDAVRRSIRDGDDPLATTFLFLADRAAHVAQIRQALQEGRHVLCDRFLHSTLAYQSVTLEGRVPDALGWLRGLHEPWCPVPDAVLWFDAPPDECVRRTRGRDDEDTPYEQVAFLSRVRQQYAALAAKDGFVVIDAHRSQDEVVAAATAAVRRLLA